MSRLLDELDSRFRPQAFELIARCIEAGIQVMIITTSRTIQEQQEAVDRGVSWTMNSKHLPQPPEQKSLALDIAPFDTFQLHGPDKLQWNGDDPVWLKIGLIGQSIGLKWGVIKNNKQIDPGHFEHVI